MRPAAAVQRWGVDATGSSPDTRSLEDRPGSLRAFAGRLAFVSERSHWGGVCVSVWCERERGCVHEGGLELKLASTCKAWWLLPSGPIVWRGLYDRRWLDITYLSITSEGMHFRYI